MSTLPVVMNLLPLPRPRRGQRIDAGFEDGHATGAANRFGPTYTLALACLGILAVLATAISAEGGEIRLDDGIPIRLINSSESLNVMLALDAGVFLR